MIGTKNFDIDSTKHFYSHTSTLPCALSFVGLRLTSQFD